MEHTLLRLSRLIWLPTLLWENNLLSTTTKSVPTTFATLGVPVLSGREFARADDENAPSVVNVNRTDGWHRILARSGSD